MFNSRYYKNNYVFTSEENEYTFFELNKLKGEYYEHHYYHNNSGNLEHAIILRNMNYYSSQNGTIDTLQDFLINHNFDEKEFQNPFTRTRKIALVLDRMNIENHIFVKPKIKK